MGKSTISMAIFNSYVSHYQRVSIGIHCYPEAVPSPNFSPLRQLQYALRHYLMKVWSWADPAVLKGQRDSLWQRIKSPQKNPPKMFKRSNIVPRKRDEKRWKEMKRDEKRWKEMKRDEKRWKEMKRDEKRWKEMKRDEKRWKEMKRDEKRWKDANIWQWVKTLYPCSSHQNSWDLWMFIPLQNGINRYWSIAICQAKIWGARHGQWDGMGTKW